MAGKYTPEQLADMRIQMEQLESLSRRHNLNEDQAAQLRELQRKLGVDIARSRKSLVEDAERQLAVEKELLKVADNANERIAGRIDVAEAEYDLQRSKLQLLQAELEALHEVEELDEERIAHKTAELQAQRELTAETKKTADAVSNVEKATNKALGATLGISDAWEDTVWGSIMNAEDGLEQFQDTLKSTFGDMDKLMGSLTMAVIETSISFALMEDEVLAGFNKTTMAGGRYNDQLKELNESNRQIGATLQENSDAFQSMHMNLNQFTFMTEEAQNAMADFAAEMSVMGVDVDTTTEFVNNAMLSFGKSGEEARDMQLKILGVADALGIAGDKMMKDFVQATPRLAEFGAKGEQVFSELAAQAKATGMEVAELIGIAQSFDTYESAAQSVGQLNAIMGGPLLNTTEMLIATDSERIDMLVQSMEMGELQWNQMNRFQKKAVANAAGITDMAKAEAMFSKGAAGLREHQKAAEADALAAEEQARMQRENVTMMNQLMITLQELAVALQPVLNFIQALASGASSLENATGALTMAINTGIIAWGGYRTAMVLAGVTKKQMIGLTFSARMAEIKLGLAKRWTMITEMASTAKRVAGSAALAIRTGLMEAGILTENLHTMSIGRGTVAQGIHTAAKWAGTVAQGAFNVAKSIGTGIMIASATAMAGLSLATGALGLSTISTTLATWAMNAAMYANPIGLVVIAVVALIAVFVILIKKFGSVKAGFQAMGAGLKKIMAGIVNFFLRGVNLMIRGLNALSVTVPKWVPVVGGKHFGFDIEPVELLAQGTADFAGGQAVVGEEGPELVTLPPHSSVVNNNNTERIMAATAAASTAAATPSAPAAATAPAAAGGGGPTTVVLQLNEREIGRVVIDSIKRSQVLNVTTG